MKKRVTKMTAILSVLILVIAATGCGKKSNSENLMKGIKPGTVKNEAELSDCETGVYDFAVRLLQNSQTAGKNVSISPLSVLSALAMTVNGAEGETRSQMEAVLGMPVAELNAYMKQYVEALPRGDAYKLNLANAIWFTEDDRFTVKQDFLQTNADYYGADIYQAPFNNETCKDINNWVKDKTEKMIPEILDEIPNEAVMYLVNALAFEAEWQDVYNENQVREDQFRPEAGALQDAEFMYGEENIYLEDEKASGFVKYYKDGKYAFVALLPNEGVSVSEYIQSLTGDHLKALLTETEDVEVDTAIPKFETEYDTEMSEVLEKMGMPLAFDEEKADFSGLGTYEDGNIYINRVLHKTYISVAEKGTKAGAATAVEMVAEMSLEAPERKTVYLDRPFLYMLIDCEKNVPFFMGTMVDLTGEGALASAGEKVEYSYKDSTVSIYLPEDWEYVTENGELKIWPKECTEGTISIQYHEDLFGVCGTGLETETITLGGKEASKGTYDGDKMWSFITFVDETNPYVILSDGAAVWWDTYEEEAMQILDTLEF